MKRMFRILSALLILACLVPALATAAALPEPAANAVDLAQAVHSLTPAQKALVQGVDCNAGATLSEALRSNRVDLVIWFTGTCVEELVTVDRDDVVIRGIGPDATLVGALLVDASSRVKLRNFTVRDPVETGIDIQRGASVRLANINVFDSPFRGILAEESELELFNVLVQTSAPTATVGVLNRASRITLEGTLEAIGYNVSGISATLAGRYWINGADIYLHDNPGSGAIFQINAGITFSNGRLRANNNGSIGVNMRAGAMLQHGNVEIELNNNFVGMLVGDHSSFGPFVGFTADVTAEGNAFAGVVAQETSGFVIRGGTQSFSNNGAVGVGATDISRITLDGSSTITGNAQGNVTVLVNSLARIGENNTIDPPIVCDSSSTVIGDDCDVVIDGVRAGEASEDLLEILLVHSTPDLSM